MKNNEENLNNDENNSIDEPVVQNEPIVDEDNLSDSDLNEEQSSNMNSEFQNLRNNILSEIEDDKNYDDEYSREKIKKKKKKSPLKAVIFAAVIVLISIGLAGGILLTVAEIMGMSATEEIIQVEIPKGSSGQAIANILKDNNIIRSTFLFRFVAKNDESKFNYGIFTLNPHMSYGQVIVKLEESAPIEGIRSFTIIEGDTLQTIAKRLEKKNFCTAKGFMNVVNVTQSDYSFEKEMSSDPLVFYRSEGYTFPDTYKLHKGMTAEEIVKLFFGNFNNKITPAMRDRMLELKMTLSEVITLASVIQAEAANIKDMAKVSGVFHNRLNNSSEFPRLQSDPTSKYVKEVIKPNNDEPNKAMENDYDTYKGYGLPPGPIGNPGLDAINAALNPDTSGNNYYFCSNIRTKEFFYATTLPQHNSNLSKAGLL